MKLFNKKTKLLLVSGLLCVLLSGIPVPEKSFGMTIQEEEELSREFMKVVFNRYSLIKDSVIVNYVNQVGNRILANISPQPFKYHFYVLKEDVYNAFATPAGHIFINSGLFEAMENEEELAGILCHEISHVTARHISQKIDRSKKVQIATLAGIAAGALLGIGGSATAANAVTMGSMAAGQSMMLAYSREDEMQADQIGLNYLEKSGYSGRGLITMLKKIRSKDWFGSKIPTYLKTHPASEDRINYIDSWLARNPKPDFKGDDYGFRRAHTFLSATYGDKDTSHRMFKKAVKDQPDDPMAHYGYGLILARVGERKEAAVYIRAALEKNAFDPYMLKDLGKVYFLNGDYDQALNILKNSLNINQIDPEGFFYLGRAQLGLGKFEDAIASLQHIIDASPDYHQAYYFLGEAYGKQDKLGDAHYYLGLFYYKTGKVKNAMFHLNRAMDNINEKEKKRKIKEIMKEIQKTPRS